MLSPNPNAPAPVLITGSTLDEAYAKLILHFDNNKGFRISPLTLSVGADGPDEMLATDGVIRDALENAYKVTNSKASNTRHAYPIDIVAFTIFPKRFYDISDNVDDFYELYRQSFPRLKALNKANRRGLYFERLTMYGDNAPPPDGNQLKWFIDRYKSRKGVRESMYQAAIFDPTRDHSKTALLGFPCLHSLSFVPNGKSLALNAFYPTQQVYRKAYGNYLGLINLGGFMAEQMGLTFCRLNVMVGSAKLDTAKTTELKPVVDACRKLVR